MKEMVDKETKQKAVRFIVAVTIAILLVIFILTLLIIDYIVISR